MEKEKMNRRKLTDEEMEQVTGGQVEESVILQFDPEPGSHPKPKPKPKLEPIPFYPADAICVNRNKGTEACILVNKGQLIQCSGCSNNHD